MVSESIARETGPTFVRGGSPIVAQPVTALEVQARFDFLTYIRLVHGWEPPPHQLEWIAALQALADGEMLDADGKPSNRLIILAPPGSGKPTLAASSLLGI